MTAFVHAARKSFADHRPHRTAEKAELENRRNQRNRLDATLHDDQRIVFFGILARLFEPFGITPAVAKLQRIDRQHFGADFEAAFHVEQHIETVTRGKPVVMPALRADKQVFFQIGAIKHGFAGAAFAPQPFRHHLFRAAAVALDLGRQKLL